VVHVSYFIHDKLAKQQAKNICDNLNTRGQALLMEGINLFTLVPSGLRLNMHAKTTGMIGG
jgi:hypothetical protein